MAKRNADPSQSLHRKRQKIKGSTVSETESNEIHTFRDLQLLLALDQELGSISRQNIQSFKYFLASIANAAESDDRSAKRAWLLDYLQSQAPSEGKEISAYFGDIIKTWHFAAQSNSDSLFASVVAVLTLLFRTISCLIEFREHGNRLCMTVLHDDQTKLLDRALGAHRSKDYLISPCLQLLTEVVVFDGGYAARTIYHQREITFKRLDVFLGMRKDFHGDIITGLKKCSVRENALAYLFANLRLQNPAAKMNIIAQGKVLHSLLDDIKEDSSSVILEVLAVLKRDIAMDGAISHTAKGRVFNQWTLTRLATLYGYNERGSLPDGYQGVQRSVHEFLVLLCTSPDCGLVEIQTESSLGVHSVTADKALESFPQRDITDKLDDEDRQAKRNRRLQMFLQTLRPYTSVSQRDLILAVFRNLPELIPDYFSLGKVFSFDPKLTTTWIGYASFLLATIKIPVPGYLTSFFVNDAGPCLYGKIIEMIIPKPCTQKMMTRCLNQSVNLVKFLTLQILNAAFEKLVGVLQRCEDSRKYMDNPKTRLAWCQITSKLRDEFYGRIPELKHVISQFRSCAKDNTMLRESTARLIASYYKVIPHVALEEKFDISVTLSAVLIDLESSGESHEEGGMHVLELEHLLEIGHRSPNMQWWHKPDTMWLSPLTMLLKHYLDRIKFHTKYEQLRTLIETVITESQILRSNTVLAPLDSLVISLQDFDDWKASGRVFEYLDHCILRLVRKPVHYYDILTDLIAAAELDFNPRHCQVDLLLVTIVDQWHFLVKSTDVPTVINVSRWLVRFIEVINLGNGYLEMLSLQDETTKLLSRMRDQLQYTVPDTTCRAVFEKTFKIRPELEVLSNLVAANITSRTAQKSRRSAPSPKANSESPATFLPPGPPEETQDYPGLHQWTRHEIQDAISEGHVKALVLCLCSKHVEIRKQALTAVRAFKIKLEESGYSEWQQMYTLCGEIVETAANVIVDDPLAYYAAVLAADLFRVVDNPLHLMYVKVNEFLNRGPEWNVTKLPSYWVDTILMKPPTDDDGHYQEAEWLLDGLIDGLRTSADMEIYRKCHIFERLFSFSASPPLPQPCFQKILDLLFRCTYVNGSSTLITRCGLFSWISSRLASHPISDMTLERLKCLASRAYETRDEERVDDWTNGTLQSTLDSLPISQKQ